MSKDGSSYVERLAKLGQTTKPQENNWRCKILSNPLWILDVLVDCG